LCEALCSYAVTDADAVLETRRSRHEMRRRNRRSQGQTRKRGRWSDTQIEETRENGRDYDREKDNERRKKGER